MKYRFQNVLSVKETASGWYAAVNVLTSDDTLKVRWIHTDGNIYSYPGETPKGVSVFFKSEEAALAAIGNTRRKIICMQEVYNE